jgi:hypothetical protein
VYEIGSPANERVLLGSEPHLETEPPSLLVGGPWHVDQGRCPDAPAPTTERRLRSVRRSPRRPSA